MRSRILVVEDEPLVRDLVALNLSHAGYDVDAVPTFAEGADALASGRYELAIVDVMLPDGDGMVLVERSRRAGLRCPILLLTARGETAAKIRGLDGGADDYLTKPFDVPELLARVRALLRRANATAPTADPHARVAFGRYWVRLDTGEAHTNGGEATLPETERRLMEHLVGREGRMQSRADLLEDVWGMETWPSEATLEAAIDTLRARFEPEPEQPVHIVSVGRRGYVFRRGP